MNWKLIGKSLGHGDMRTRLLAVLGMLLVFRLMSHIPVPLGNAASVQQVLENLFNSATAPQLLGFLNMVSGGALANFSIMIAGLGPYINASIIMQLLTKAVPRLEAMQKEGEFGQKKINQYTRLLTFPLAIVQSIASIYLLKQAAQRIGGTADLTGSTSLTQWIVMVAALTGGSMLLMWLGELITERGVGNGISLLVAVGIVAGLPTQIGTLVNSVTSGDSKMEIFGQTLPFNSSALYYALGTAIAALLLTWVVVMINEASRKLTVNYAKRVQGNRAYGGITTTLPVKLITAGVVPIIFAVAFLSVPSFAGQLLAGNANPSLAQWGINLSTWFQQPTAQSFATLGWQAYIFPVFEFLLVFMFTYFYTSITFNSKDIAENLHKQGGFLEGVRSGKETEKYLARTVTRLTFFGALALGILTVAPVIAQVFINNASITIAGTSILIVVSVALQTLRAVESRALMVTYDQYSQPDFFAEMELQKEGKTPKKRRLFKRSAKKNK